MAIQVRRGLKKDFDPSKMLPGEWAVSIDSVSSNQIVWMCFAAGVCKRMGTYEDFYAQITEATKDIRDSYVSDFDEIKADIELIADVVSSNKEEVLIIKSDIVNTYLPQIRQYVSDAQMAASTATSKANSASESAVLSESYAVGGTGTRNGENTDNAKYYADEARKSAENAAEIAGGDFLTKTGDASNTTVSFTKASTRSNIISGEKQSTIFGKIMKWFADLTAPAFAQVITSYADMMSNTVAGYMPDALAVKAGFDTVNSNLVEIGNLNTYEQTYTIKTVWTNLGNFTAPFDCCVIAQVRLLNINQNTTIRIKRNYEIMNSTSSLMISGHSSYADCFGMFFASKGDIISYDAATSVNDMESTMISTWKTIPIK